MLNDYSVTDPSTIVDTTHQTVTVHLDGAVDGAPTSTDTGKPTDIVFAPDQNGNSLNPLGHFVAVDPDSTDSYTWSLADDNANGGIGIDANGNLNIAGNASTGTHDLEVTVNDSDAPDGTSTTVDFKLLIGNDGNPGDIIPSAPTFVLASTNNIEAGNGQADSLTGSAGVDYIIGGQGDDNIKGLGGADMLVGGGGDDNFIYTSVSDSTHAALTPSSTSRQEKTQSIYRPSRLSTAYKAASRFLRVRSSMLARSDGYSAAEMPSSTQMPVVRMRPLGPTPIWKFISPA